jgi:hypothetical protein
VGGIATNIEVALLLQEVVDEFPVLLEDCELFAKGGFE